MEWLFGFILLGCLCELIDEFHTKWHIRQMAKPKHLKETIYT